jgi:hypothetical protein
VEQVLALLAKAVGVVDPEALHTLVWQLLGVRRAGTPRVALAWVHVRSAGPGWAGAPGRPVAIWGLASPPPEAFTGRSRR